MLHGAVENERELGGEQSHVESITCILATLQMGGSQTDVPPNGPLPSACQAADCHCPLF